MPDEHEFVVATLGKNGYVVDDGNTHDELHTFLRKASENGYELVSISPYKFVACALTDFEPKFATEYQAQSLLVALRRRLP